MSALLLHSLAVIGHSDDAAIDLCEAALLLAALDLPEVDLVGYRNHINELTEALNEINPGLHVKAQAQALAHVFGEQFGYRGDADQYDDMQNANLIRVIDRRRGLPVSLGILYIEVARRLGWKLNGINFPAHFLVRLSSHGQQLILDPFHGGTVVETPELRALLKSRLGQSAELSPHYCQNVSNREILVRLQNNISGRALKNDQHARAREVLERIRLLSPEDPAPWRDIAMVELRLGNLKLAIDGLEKFLELADRRGDNLSERNQILILMNRLKKQLH